MILIKLILLSFYSSNSLYHLYEWDNSVLKANDLKIPNSASEIEKVTALNGLKLFIFKNATYYPKNKSQENSPLYSEKITIGWKNTSHKIIFLPLDLSYMEHSFTENNIAYKEHFLNKDPLAQASRFFTHLLVAQSESPIKPKRILNPIPQSYDEFKFPTDTTQIAALKPGEWYLKEVNLRELYGKAFDSHSPRSFWISVIYDNHLTQFTPVYKGEYRPSDISQKIFIPAWTGVIESNTLQLDVR
jgi:hypothetical protein